MTAQIKKAFPLTLGAISFAVAIGVPFLPGFDHAERGLWLVLTWFFLGGLVFVWAAFRKTPELEVTDQWISIRGSQFDRNNIISARVFRVWVNGGRGRFIEIRFREMPRLSWGWRIAKAFDRFGFPKICDKGIPLADEPRIIAPLNFTDLSDEDINQQLINSKTVVDNRLPESK